MTMSLSWRVSKTKQAPLLSSYSLSSAKLQGGRRVTWDPWRDAKKMGVDDVSARREAKRAGDKRASEELGRGNTGMSWFDNGENSRRASARRGWTWRDDKNRLNDENRAIVHTLQRRRNSSAATFGGTDEG